MRSRFTRRLTLAVSLPMVVLVAAVGCRQGGEVSVETSSPSMVATSTSLPTTSSSTSTSTSVPSTVAPSTSTAAPSSTSAPAGFDPYTGAEPAISAGGEVSDEWVETPDGRRRHFRLYVPSTFGAARPAPLLIALHGGLGSSEQFATNSGFDELAEANGFIVVYPDGVGASPARPALQTWNGGYCCGPAARQGVDDVAFVRFLIDLLEERLDLDADRIFATGHSNGAIMAYRLACELSDRIVAIGVQAGSLGIDDCQPADPVSVFHVHGLADTNHPIDGGVGSGVSGVEFRSARTAVTTLAAVNGCDDEPLVETIPSNSDVAVSTWLNCDSDVGVRLVTVEGASHAWMGHAAVSEAAAALVGGPYADFDSSRAIWSFLAAHPRR